MAPTPVEPGAPRMDGLDPHHDGAAEGLTLHLNDQPCMSPWLGAQRQRGTAPVDANARRRRPTRRLRAASGGRWALPGGATRRCLVGARAGGQFELGGQCVAAADWTALRRAARVSRRTGPAGSLLSRTATSASAVSASSTQLPPLEVLRLLRRQTTLLRSISLSPS